jgi:hypothetical protein
MLGVCTEKNRRDYVTTFLARLVERDNISRSNFALTRASFAIRVSLIEGLSARRADLQQEAALFTVEVVNLSSRGGASGYADESDCEIGCWHGAGGSSLWAARMRFMNWSQCQCDKVTQ